MSSVQWFHTTAMTLLILNYPARPSMHLSEVSVIGWTQQLRIYGNIFDLFGLNALR